MNDAAGMLNETATFCKPGDEKRPTLVGATQVCPDDLSAGADEVTDAYPDGWYVRIMFDELLDGNVETLTEVIDDATGEGTDTYTGSIADTHPVKLECESINGGMVNVDYDGYYSPSGNRVTFPLGPSLVIKPNDPTLVATNTACQVTINDNVLDKTGNPVPAEQRGPYKFKTAPIQVVVIDPSDKATVPASQMTTDGVYVQFNTTVDPASFCDEGAGMDECEFEFSDTVHGLCSTSTSATGPIYCEVAMNGADCPGTGAVCDTTPSATSLLPYGFTDTEFSFSPAAPNEVESDYTFQFKQGGKIADRCGRETTFGAPSVADQTKIGFSTDKFKITGTTIATGETASAMKKLSLNTTAIIDLASLDSTEYSLTPAPLSETLDTNGGNDFTVFGYYKINTDYTFTLNAGATVKDVYGVEYTNPTALTVKWKTQPAITATFSPADASRVAKSTPASLVGVTLTFNAPMKITGELTEGTEFTVTDSSGAAVTGFTIAAASSTSCTIYGTSCAIRIRKALAPGAYTFTLKQGATVTDQNGDVYTQAADKVIHFTVYDNPATPIQCL